MMKIENSKFCLLRGDLWILFNNLDIRSPISIQRVPTRCSISLDLRTEKGADVFECAQWIKE